MTITTRQTVSNSVNSTSPMEWRIESDASNATSSSTDGGISRRNSGRQFANVIDDFNRVGSGLPLNRQNEAACIVEPSDRFVVLDAIDHLPELLQPHRRAVLPGHDERTVRRGVRSVDR